MLKSRYFSLLLIVIAVVTSIISVYRSSHGSNDFDTYYYTGKAVLEHSGIYYKGDYYKDAFKGGPFLYAPVWACFFSLFAWMPIQLAAVIWNLLNFFIFLISLSLMGSLLSESDKKNTAWVSSANRIHLVIAGIMLLLLLFDNLTMAQINILILFLILVALAARKKGAEFLGGTILSAAILVKLTPVLFCLYFVSKKSWKVLMGVFFGGLVLTILIPALVFGFSTNHLYHRQWLGRILKPSLIHWVPKWQNVSIHPEKILPEKTESIRLTNLLVAKNQSLEAGMTRLFLKDRNVYAFDSAFPIFPAQRYSRLPVLIGLPMSALNIVIRSVQGILCLGLIFFMVWRPSERNILNSSMKISMIFLTMTLLSPTTRSHQFILWSFPITTLLYYLTRASSFHLIFKALAILATALYMFQGVPFGKAAGMGAWSNLVLWITFAMALIVNHPDSSSQSSQRKLSL